MLLRPTKNSILAGPFACSHCLNTKSTQLHLAHRRRCTLPALFVADPVLYWEWDLSVCLSLPPPGCDRAAGFHTNDRWLNMTWFLLGKVAWRRGFKRRPVWAWWRQVFFVFVALFLTWNTLKWSSKRTAPCVEVKNRMNAYEFYILISFSDGLHLILIVDVTFKPKSERFGPRSPK